MDSLCSTIPAVFCYNITYMNHYFVLKKVSMTKGHHYSHKRTHNYTLEYRRIFARSFKNLLNGPLGDYQINADWLDEEKSKFKLIKCDEWPLLMLFNIKGVDTPIPLVTDSRSASTKLYLICPYCATQKQHLHVTKRTFACAKCLKLHYASQSESEQDRLARRIRKLRVKTWGRTWPEINNLFEGSFNWSKPNGLHESTFQCITMKLIALETRYWKISIAMMDRMKNHYKFAESNDS